MDSRLFFAIDPINKMAFNIGLAIVTSIRDTGVAQTNPNNSFPLLISKLFVTAIFALTENASCLIDQLSAICKQAQKNTIMGTK